MNDFQEMTKNKFDTYVSLYDSIINAEGELIFEEKTKIGEQKD